MSLKKYYIREAGKKLGFPIEISCRAYLMYHQCLYAIDEFMYDKSEQFEILLGAALLVLSAIHDGIHCNIDDVIQIYYDMEHNDGEVLTNNQMKALKINLVKMICLALRTLEYKLHHKIANKYLMYYLLILRNYVPCDYEDYLPVTCLKFLTDFYTNKKSMGHLAEHIAIACIDVCLRSYALSLFETQGFISSIAWQKACCSDITQEKLKEIIEDILSIYENE